MPQHFKSMNTQNTLIDASNSLDKAENAVKQVQSHTTKTMIAQAEQSIDHAEQAVQATQNADNQIAARSLKARLENTIETLADTQSEQ